MSIALKPPNLVDTYSPDVLSFKQSSPRGEKNREQTVKGIHYLFTREYKAKRRITKTSRCDGATNELVTWDDGQLTPGNGALQEDLLKKLLLRICFSISSPLRVLPLKLQ